MDAEISYDGWIIRYDEDADWWTSSRGDDNFRRSTLKEAKKTIDRGKRHSKKFKPVLAWYFDHTGPVTVKVTSITPDGEIWISHQKDRKREKLYRSKVYGLYKHNGENDSIVTKIRRLRENKEAIDMELSDLKLTLDPLEIKVPED